MRHPDGQLQTMLFVDEFELLDRKSRVATRPEEKGKGAKFQLIQY